MLHVMRALILGSLLFSVATAEEYKTTVVLSGLNNPCGVAVHPSGRVYVAESGALQVVRVNKVGENAKAVPVITDFPKDVYGKGPMYDIGPLGLAFLTGKMLIVGGGGNPDGSELLRVYELPKGRETIKAEQMKYSLGPMEPGEATSKGEGNFYGLAVDNRGIYVTANGDDTKGWVLKAPLKKKVPQGLEPFIATKEAVMVDAPVGITICSEGNLVVGQMGEITVPLDSLVTVYDAKSGQMLNNYRTNLFDIAAMGTSPSGGIYALDFAWMDTTQGSLSKIEMSAGEAEVTKLMSLDKPTAMAFDKEGRMFVTVIGTPEDGSDKPNGKLLMIEGDF
ncbi:Hypothetical protein PBC10988_17550 [Planctomycetales bacterium 10988]|nr:Hypothetical protein PBC10988_17550 [Planctomycetales bacterium 10988]